MMSKRKSGKRSNAAKPKAQKIDVQNPENPVPVAPVRYLLLSTDGTTPHLAQCTMFPLEAQKVLEFAHAHFQGIQQAATQRALAAEQAAAAQATPAPEQPVPQEPAPPAEEVVGPAEETPDEPAEVSEPAKPD